MIYLKNSAKLTLDKQKCTGCGMCLEVCPHAVFILEDKKALITNKDFCMECGACQKNCPFYAIKVRTGVGCAYAVLKGKLKSTEPTCGCSNDSLCC